MITFEKDNYLPKPSDELIDETEGALRVIFPKDFIAFLKQHNGAVPNEKEFNFRGHQYYVERFLDLIDADEDNPYECYDIEFIITQLEDRLVTESTEYGVEIVPFALLFAGDFVCFDYRGGQDNENPPVCIFYHEMSVEDKPCALKIANSFTEFLNMLKKDDGNNAMTYLDAQMPEGKRPIGYIWHHGYKPGSMELIELRMHNMYSHSGPREPGGWADSGEYVNIGE